MERLNRLLDQWTLETLVPAFVLMFLLATFVITLAWAQFNKKNTFDVANFFRDDAGRESSGRAFGFICLAIHSWWVITLVFQGKATVDHFLYYGLIWSGAPVALALVNRWGGNLPFSPAGFPPSVINPGSHAPQNSAADLPQQKRDYDYDTRPDDSDFDQNRRGLRRPQE